MKALALMLLLFEVVEFSLARDQISYWIESDPKTNWGKWKPHFSCGDNTWISGFNMESDINKAGDLTSIDWLQFFCSYNELEGKLTKRKIMPNEHWVKLHKNDLYLATKSFWAVSIFGLFSKSQECPGNGFAVGFELKVQEPQGNGGDDTATNDIRLICRDKNKGDLTFEYLYLSSEYKDAGKAGDWTGAKWCHKGFALCGWHLQIDGPPIEEVPEDFSGKSDGKDRTGLNNIRMKCCEYYDPVNCIAKVTWREILVADNRKGISGMNYEKKYTHGWETEISNFERHHTQTKDTEKVRVEAEAKAAYGPISARIKTEYEKTTEKIEEHTKESKNSEKKSGKTEDTYETWVGPLTYSVSEQGIGVCGVIEDESKYFRKKDDASILLAIILVPLFLILALIVALVVYYFCFRRKRNQNNRVHPENPPSTPAAPPSTPTSASNKSTPAPPPATPGSAPTPQKNTPKTSPNSA